MKLSVSDMAWKRENGDEACRLAAEKGCTGIEVAPAQLFGENPYENPDRIVEYEKRLMEHYGLTVSALYAIWDGRTENLFESKESRKQLLAYTRKAIEFAEAIDCRILVFECHANRNMGKKANYVRGVEFFCEVGEFAFSRRKVVVIKPIPARRGTNCMNNIAETAEMVWRVNSRGLKLDVDTSSMISNRETADEVLRHIELVGHVHISEPEGRKIKDRGLYSRLAQILHENDYSGYVTVAMSRRRKLEDMGEALDYVKELFL